MRRFKYRNWQATWKKHIKSFFRKFHALNKAFELYYATELNLGLWSKDLEPGDDGYGVYDFFFRGQVS